ncbi:MAG: beta-galactosidase [Chitinophagales bacterium]|jgi:beta-galactosidase
MSNYRKLMKHFLFFFFLGLFNPALSQYNYIENPELFEENTMNAHAYFVFDTQEDVRDITENSNYFFLNGGWFFQHSNVPEDRPIDFYQTDFNTDGWNTIPVPGDWQMYGYDYPIYTNWKYPFKADKPFVPKDFNPVGSYKKNFSLPADWKPTWDEIVLHFGGVNSCFFVWINGKYVGYSEDSKLPSEFLVSNYLKAGENQVAVEVYKYCDGTYLEDQDMWRLSGIERDVYLYKQPEVYIEDFMVQASLDESYSIGELSLEISTVFPKISSSVNHLPVFTYQCQLISEDSSVVWKRYAVLENDLDTPNKQSFKGQIPAVKTWSAQHPNLYNLVISIRDEQNNLMQKVEQKVGFRSLEITDGIFYINGEVAEIKGVNRHEHDPNWGHAVGYTGNVFNEDSLRKDLELIKSLNFNAVRTAHYPNHPLFYDLCDELGLYVCDEANVEGHFYMMFKPLDNLAIDPDYKQAVLSRIYNMYQRDKNHSAIIMWSVGNETGTGKTMVEAYRMLKNLDEERPVFNERHFFLNTIKEKHSDFNGNMYAPIEKVKKIIDKDNERPFIWIEYAHAMGNSTGNFADLWEFVRSESQVQGGFIWDWRDQGIWKTNENGERFLGYGGHFEPADNKFTGGLQGDGNFCANGVISSDGKLHPGADIIKHVQSNIRIEMINDFSYRFINDFEELNLSEFEFWLNKQQANGKGGFGRLRKITCQAMSDTIVHIKPQGELAGDLSALMLTGSNGEFRYKKNFFFKAMDAPKVSLSTEATVFQVDAKNYTYVIANEHVSFLLTKNGHVNHLVVDGELQFIDGPKVNFWRAPTDNDFGNKAQKRLSFWKTAAARSQLVSLDHRQIKNYYFIQTQYELPEKKGDFFIDYKVYGDGVIQVNLNFDLRNTDEIPRIGSYLKLPKEFDLLHYYGLGPRENYVDRQDGQWFFEYYLALNKDPEYPKLQVQEMPYIRPQEYGNRTKTYLIDLYSPSDSLKITGNDLSFSAWTHSLDDIDEGLEKQGKTVLDIPKRDFIWLNIDYGQTGVGGDNSWGRKPYDKYVLKGGRYTYYYTIQP